MTPDLPPPIAGSRDGGVARRIGIAVASSVTYLIMCFVVGFATAGPDVSWEAMLLIFFALVLLGHALWAFVVRSLIHPPRRDGRLATMTVCTPAVVLAGLLIVWDRTVGPVGLGWVIVVVTPAAFGYWASRPLPPAPSEEGPPPPSPLPGFLRPGGRQPTAPPPDHGSTAATDGAQGRSWRRIGDRRIRVAVAAPITYALMGVVVGNAILRTVATDAETFGEALFDIFATTFRYMLLGILAWSALMVVMIRPPRRIWRIAIFVCGTPVSFVVAAFVIPHGAVGPWPIRIVFLLVPALLGYWAAAPAPMTVSQHEPQRPLSTVVAD